MIRSDHNELPETSKHSATKGIPDRIGWAVLSMFFGFFPVNLVALYYSICVGRRLRDGNADAAARCSRRAAYWIWAAFIAQILGLVILMYGHGRSYLRYR